MKKNKLLFVLAILAILISATTGNAQGIDKIAQTGMKWLSIPIGARGAALGNAYTAGTPDAAAMFWNPAGLALVEKNHVFFNRTQWIADINLNAAAVSFKLGGIGTIGISFMSVDWGTFKGTQFTGGLELFERTGEFSPEDFAVGISFSRQISDKFIVGGSVKILHEDLHGGFEGTRENYTYYDGQLNAVAFDFGTLFYTGYKDLRFGVSIQNISAEYKYRFESFPLPLSFKFGLAMDLAQSFFVGEDSEQSVTLLVDAIHPRDFSERIHIGLEYGFREMFFLRAGYKTNYDEEDLSLGAGLRYGISDLELGVDYSYISFENFDAVHMFSFDLGF